MRKRLRKKKHRGEFQELGFEVDGRLCPEMDLAAIHGFTDRLIEQIESLDLAFGGGIGSSFGGFVTKFGCGSVTEEERGRIVAFLANDRDVTHYEVGALRDAWYE